MTAQTVGPASNDTSKEMITETTEPLDGGPARISNEMDTPEMSIELPEDEPSDKNNNICSVSFPSS